MATETDRYLRDLYDRIEAGHRSPGAYEKLDAAAQAQAQKDYETRVGSAAEKARQDALAKAATEQRAWDISQGRTAGLTTPVGLRHGATAVYDPSQDALRAGTGRSSLRGPTKAPLPRTAPPKAPAKGAMSGGGLYGSGFPTVGMTPAQPRGLSTRRDPTPPGFPDDVSEPTDNEGYENWIERNQGITGTGPALSLAEEPTRGSSMTLSDLLRSADGQPGVGQAGPRSAQEINRQFFDKLLKGDIGGAIRFRNEMYNQVPDLFGVQGGPPKELGVGPVREAMPAAIFYQQHPWLAPPPPPAPEPIGPPLTQPGPEQVPPGPVQFGQQGYEWVYDPYLGVTVRRQLPPT